MSHSLRLPSTRRPAEAGARLAALLVAGLALAACGASHRPVNTARIIGSIKADEVRWNADYRAGDAAKIASHYAPDAVVMFANMRPVTGAAAIQAALSQVVSQPGFSVTFSSDRVDVAASGDLATSRGAYKQSSTDPGTGAVSTEEGAYVTVFKPGPNGVWKAVWDIDTPSAPASVQPAAAAAN